MEDQKTTMEIAVLLGAGASVPQMPSTDDLTGELERSFDTWIRDGTANLPYRFASNQHVEFSQNHSSRENLQRLKQLWKAITPLRASSSMTYEEVYSIADQVRQHLSQDYENNALIPTIDYLCRVLGPTGRPDTSDELQERCKELTTLIRCIVTTGVSGSSWHRCSPDGKPHNLDVLIGLLAKCERLHIMTTNFDTLIEDALSASDIEFTDGFDPTTEFDEQVVRWSPDTTLSEMRSTVSLYKLHGSRNWSWVHHGPTGRLLFLAKVVRTIKPNPYLDDDHRLLDSSGLLLSGKTNKLLSYNQGWAYDLMCLARSSLRRCKHLVVAGYGFGDEGINFRILDWMQDSEHKMFVVDPKGHNTFAFAAGAIAPRFDEWWKAQRVTLFNGSLSDLDPETLSNWLV